MRGKNDKKERYSRYAAGGAIVIAGILLFLNVLGVITFSFWSAIAQYWPIGLIIIGIALILRMKWIAWIFAIMTLALLIVYLISLVGSGYITESGNITTRQYETTNFSGIVLAMPAELYIQQGEKDSIVIEADSNIVKEINVDMKGDDATLSYTRRAFFLHMFEPGKVKVYVTSNNIRKIEIDGTGNIKSNGTLTSDYLEMTTKGAGNIEADVAAERLNATIEGVGNMKLRGSSTTYIATISGAGNMDASSLQTQNSTVRISGTGDAKVNVSSYLDAAISGVGNIIYLGDPQVKQLVSGAGNIKKG